MTNIVSLFAGDESEPASGVTTSDVEVATATAFRGLHALRIALDRLPSGKGEACRRYLADAVLEALRRPRSLTATGP